MKRKYIDLHVHTNFSDGEKSIGQVIKLAKKNNVGVLSLTEHYNISSYKEACELAGEDIQIIKGIELGADMSYYDKSKKHICHLLGYFVSSEIYSLLDRYELDRYDCVKQILKLLNDDGIKISMRNVLRSSKNKNSIGRIDVARALVKLNYAKSVNEAYGKYLDHNNKAYVRRNKPTPQELIKYIISCGGVPVLAHPKSLRLKNVEEEEFIKELVKSGLCGIEVYNPNNGKETRSRYLSYCKKYNLVGTVGSDYHGRSESNSSVIGLGKNNNLRISNMSIVDMLYKKKREIDKKRKLHL